MTSSPHPTVPLNQRQSIKQSSPFTGSIESLIKNSRLISTSFNMGDLTSCSEMSSHLNSYRISHIKKGVIRISKMGKRVKFIDDINPNIPLCEFVDIKSIKEYNLLVCDNETHSEKCSCLII